jgi:uncharacterized damage-inducible protein DinB
MAQRGCSMAQRGRPCGPLRADEDAPMDPAPAAFAAESARYLRAVYLPRLERALAILPPGDLWWSPHPECLSVGTILRHLEGNLRQWILSGLAGAADRRDRASEFASPERPDAAQLLQQLRATLDAAAAHIERMDAAALACPQTIQGFATTGLGAVYHVVEHVSWHTGQAVWIAKARAGAGHGLAFFDEAAVNAARNAPR